MRARCPFIWRFLSTLFVNFYVEIFVDIPVKIYVEFYVEVFVDVYLDPCKCTAVDALASLKAIFDDYTEYATDLGIPYMTGVYLAEWEA